jgi:hypothetical protein
MSTVATGDDGEGSGSVGGTNDELVARVIHYETGDELTLFPPHASGVDLMTRWLTAGPDSWVDLDAMC